MAHQAHTPFELCLEHTGDRITRFFKRLGLRLLNLGESMGSSRAAQHLFAQNCPEQAQAVMNLHRESAIARARLIERLKKEAQ